MYQDVTVKQLLESGVHFGHPTRRWNPKMAPYIFTDRSGVYIIDLEKTLKYLKEACLYLKEVASTGGIVLFVGTKRQAQEAIKNVAAATGMPYVTERWLGGMLTNFETVKKSVTRLERLENMEEEGTYQFLTKKEVNALKKKREKLEFVLAGVRQMKKLPQALFVIDPSEEEIAILEARKLGIPVIALIDTNCDPDLVDYLIPGNDDAIRSIKLVCECVGTAVKEGRDAYATAYGIAPTQPQAELKEGEAVAGEAGPGDEEGGEEDEEHLFEKHDSEIVKSKVKKTKTRKAED